MCIWNAECLTTSNLLFLLSFWQLLRSRLNLWVKSKTLQVKIWKNIQTPKFGRRPKISGSYLKKMGWREVWSITVHAREGESIELNIRRKLPCLGNVTPKEIRFYQAPIIFCRFRSQKCAIFFFCKKLSFFVFWPFLVLLKSNII